VRAQDGRRFASRGSVSSARQAERSRKRGAGAAAPTCHVLRFPRQRTACEASRAQRKAGGWGRQPLPAKRFVARGIEPPVRQAERSGKRGFKGGSPHLQLKNSEGGLYSRNHSQVRECKAPSRAPLSSKRHIHVQTTDHVVCVHEEAPGAFRMRK